jgi:hypothetical protein
MTQLDHSFRQLPPSLPDKKPVPLRASLKVWSEPEQKLAAVGWYPNLKAVLRNRLQFALLLIGSEAIRMAARLEK